MKLGGRERKAKGRPVGVGRGAVGKVKKKRGTDRKRERRRKRRKEWERREGASQAGAVRDSHLHICTYLRSKNVLALSLNGTQLTSHLLPPDTLNYQIRRRRAG